MVLDTTSKNKDWLVRSEYNNISRLLIFKSILNYNRPQNPKELFNLRHSSLRNVVERIFGVVKRKYKVLSHPAEYSTQTQVYLVTALTALHNFVRQHEGPNADIYLSKNTTAEVEEPDQDAIPAREISIFESSHTADSKIMDAFRDRIAERMWKDYKHFNTQN